MNYLPTRKEEEMSNIIDPLDDKIIRILQSNSRKSFVEIADEIRLSESAVRRRVKHLIDSGIIKRFTIELESSNKTSAIALISVTSTADTSTVSSNLMKLSGVDVIYEITGQYDIAAIIVAPTIAEINNYIDDVRKIEGVSDTNTVIILKTMR
jgi:Lrp/AsnC family transcriptional regulator, involved in the regulation of lysine biosynthesis